MNPITVSELGNYIKQILRNDIILSNVTVSGELSSFSLTAKGHCFFTIKDKDATLKCAMFRKVPDASLSQSIGMEVVVTGAVNAYTATSTYQLVATQVERRQPGALYMELEMRKQALQKEGLFDRDKKRPIPGLPSRIAIITSPMGAAIHDLIHIIQRRSPMTTIELYPVMVQGKSAPESMIRALEYFNGRDDISTVIIGRGGGSFEDLYCFNDEDLVRAVAASRHPIISAVGHESDSVLTDYAADFRAATPTAAGEFATRVDVELKSELSQCAERMQRIVDHLWTDESDYLYAISEALLRQNPMQRMEHQQTTLNQLKQSLIQWAHSSRDKWSHQLEKLELRLQASNPNGILQKGYAIVQKEDRVITDASEVAPGDHISVRFQSSQLTASVQSVSKKGEEDGV